MKTTGQAHFLKICMLTGRSTAVDSRRECVAFIVLRRWAIWLELSKGEKEMCQMSIHSQHSKMFCDYSVYRISHQIPSLMKPFLTHQWNSQHVPSLIYTQRAVTLCAGNFGEIKYKTQGKSLYLKRSRSKDGKSIGLEYKWGCYHKNKFYT